MHEVVANAIRVLEQEPCEDAISRQALLNMYECLDEESRVYAGQVVRDIKALPPIKPVSCIAKVNFSKEDMQELVNEKMKDIVVERKKGEWCKQNDDYSDWYVCSECGYGSEGEMQYSSECDVRTKYCPNCGAEMEGEDE